MTINEAIKHCEEVMTENLEKTKDRNASDPIAINCFECADEHRQLAEWLKDYKRLLEQESKTGKWIEENKGLFGIYPRCSECNELYHTKEKYCPNCGCRMKSEVDG